MAERQRAPSSAAGLGFGRVDGAPGPKALHLWRILEGRSPAFGIAKKIHEGRRVRADNPVDGARHPQSLIAGLPTAWHTLPDSQLGANVARNRHATDVAVHEVLLQHKRAGYPVAVWRDERVVWVPPEDIPEQLADEPRER